MNRNKHPLILNAQTGQMAFLYPLPPPSNAISASETVSFWTALLTPTRNVYAYGKKF